MKKEEEGSCWASPDFSDSGDTRLASVSQPSDGSLYELGYGYHWPHAGGSYSEWDATTLEAFR